MPISLYKASVRTYLQILPSLAGLIDTAEEHCRTNNVQQGALTAARLADDMWPFAKQVFECGHHSARAIESVFAGVFRPELEPTSMELPALRWKSQKPSPCSTR